MTSISFLQLQKHIAHRATSRIEARFFMKARRLESQGCLFHQGIVEVVVAVHIVVGGGVHELVAGIGVEGRVETGVIVSVKKKQLELL